MEEELNQELFNYCLQKSAQAWCEDKTSNTNMEPDLAESFARILYQEIVNRPTGFRIPKESQEKLNDWLKEQDRLAVEKQKETFKDPSVIIKQCWEEGFPYTGAAGGGITFMFAPTSLGLVVKVKYSLTDAEIDLTDYENW